ncbi:hypothetical protein [Stecheria intestinalis]|uniref:hypothetical protein n=1 Tax=Stecheria intestinalis TaxID=2606630 RepID=UPI0023F39DA4|nr:hypothetical protein [Stecheria intestinalis]MDD5882360.1 hypothetical protein [Stecheria intestinalis]
MPAAGAGFEGIGKRKLNVTIGLAGGQEIFLLRSPMMKKILMDNVYRIQIRSNAEK